MQADNSTDTAHLVHQTLQRLASQSAACKLWSAGLAAGVLAWAHSIRLGSQSMLWAVAPVGLLALADAAYATQASRLLKKFRQGKKPGVEELLQTHVPLSGADTLGGLAGLLSASVWPYYVALTCAFLIAGREPARPALPVPQNTGINRITATNPPVSREAQNAAPLRAAPMNGVQPPAQLRAPSGTAFSPTNSPRPKAPVNTTPQSSPTPSGPAARPPGSSTTTPLPLDASPSSPVKSTVPAADKEPGKK
jgi:hypothetical protein